MRFNNLFLSLFVFLFFIESNAQQGTKLTLTHENDFLFIRNNDENYTGGLNLGATFKAFKVWQPFLELKGDSKNFQVIGIGGTGYTPLDLASEEIVEGDRPYASLVYLSFGKQSACPTANLTSKLYIGLIGSSGPGKVQYFLHDNHIFGTTRPNPVGWDNQIANGGSLILNYNVHFQKNLYKPLIMKSKAMYLTSFWTAGLNVGNLHTNVQGGFYIDAVNINAFPIFGVDNIPVPVGVAAMKKNKSRPFRMNFYLNPAIRAVGYNATLQGALFYDDSAYKIPSEDIKRLVLELNAGINLLIYDAVLIRYSAFGRSQEFEGGKKFHFWGGLTIGVGLNNFF